MTEILKGESHLVNSAPEEMVKSLSTWVLWKGCEQQSYQLYR